MTPVIESRDKILQSLSRLPPFSPVLNKVLASISQEDVSFAAISDFIESDTVLAGNILKIVNSAMHGRRGTVNSVRHAVSMLGMNKLRNAVLSMSIERMWSSVRTPPGWSMARFNLHSVSVGILCDVLAQRVRVEYPEGAFVAGLLHDVGRLLIAAAVPNDYQEVEKLYNLGGRSWCECETEILGFTHAEISAQALAMWNLPEPIRTAVGEHHSVIWRPGSASGAAIPLATLVFAADEYVRHAGTAIEPNQSQTDTPDPLPFLTLAGEKAESVLAAWTTEVQAVGAFS